MTKTKTSLYSKFPNWTSIFLIISFFSLSDFPSTNWIERKIYFVFLERIHQHLDESYTLSTIWFKAGLPINAATLDSSAMLLTLFLSWIRVGDGIIGNCMVGWLKQWLNTMQFEKVVLRIVTTILIWTGPWVDFVVYPNQSYSEVGEWDAVYLSSICCFNSEKPHTAR